MTTLTESFSPIQTSFGKYVPCDRATYKKLKRINHILHQCARVWADRWERSQKRLPHNRYYTFKKVRFMVKDSWIFSQFWTIGTGRQSNCLMPTPLYKQFLDSYKSARYPKEKSEQVVPLSFTTEEIDRLLADIEAFAAAAK